MENVSTVQDNFGGTEYVYSLPLMLLLPVLEFRLANMHHGAFYVEYHMQCLFICSIPLPLTDLQVPPTMKQLALLSDKHLSGDAWVSIALHLGVSFDLCEEIRQENMVYGESDKTTLLFLIMAKKWLAREEGTGELPRTLDMVLKALKNRYQHASPQFEVMVRKLLLENA